MAGPIVFLGTGNVAVPTLRALAASDEELALVVTQPDRPRKRGRKLIRDEDLDDKHRNLVKLTDGRLAAWVYCGAATDVAPAVQTAKENGLLEHLQITPQGSGTPVPLRRGLLQTTSDDLVERLGRGRRGRYMPNIH